MAEAGQRVLRVVFRADRQQHADVLLAFDVTLKFQKRLSVGRFFAQIQPLRAVVADDAAPERVVHIQRQHFFVASENGFDDRGDAVRQRGDGLQRHCVFVHIPHRLVGPAVQPVTGGGIAEVVNEQVRFLCRRKLEARVETVDEIGLAVDVRRVAVPVKPEKRVFKVVLHNRTGECGAQPFPHLGKVALRVYQPPFDGLRAVVGMREIRRKVAEGRVHIDHVRRERLQRRIAEHGVLPILCVFGLIENRPDALGQQEQLQHVADVVGRRPAEDGDFLLDSFAAVGQQRLFQLSPRPQQLAGVERVGEGRGRIGGGFTDVFHTKTSFRQLFSSRSICVYTEPQAV